MNTVKTIMSIIIIAAFGVTGVFLCMGKCSFLLGTVRDMEPGPKKTLLTRINGIILLAITVILTIVVFFKYGPFINQPAYSYMKDITF